jgi:class 3 adenylate cyclase/predicted ATPase
MVYAPGPGARRFLNGMAFERVLTAAIDLLRRRRRITQRWLQRQFELDDDTLADLVHELIHGQCVARLEGEDVLVWHEAHTVAPAERRQLTVMFCDLVGSTRLAATLDPEDLREVLQRYQAECRGVLQPLGGHIAQYLGDGVLAYFGYPSANEDDAERAVRAGLALVQAVRRLNALLRARFRVELAVRVGIHTGLVVIGDVGSVERRETLALGEAPNLAAHIQALAEPNTVLVSEATFGLLRGRFAAEPGEQLLQSGHGAMRLLHVARETDGASAAMSAAALIDRDGHAERLHFAWGEACAGRGSAMLVRGEAGLGKTRLAEALRSTARAASAEVIVLRCSAFHRHTALHPFAEHLGRRAGLEADSPSDDVSERLAALLDAAGLLTPRNLSLFAALVSPGSAPADQAAELPPAQWMQATQEALLDWIAAAARRGPVLLVCEDLHWADASTLALLQRLVESARPPRLLALLTARPDFEPPWPADALAAALTLQRLPADTMAALVRQVAGAHTLPGALVERIVRAADGVPLYAEEITKAVLAAELDEHSAAIEVPATLQASLLARLDRLGPVKPLAQTAALLGREFSFELLAAVVDMPVAQLGPALQQLVTADLLRRRGTPPATRYTFRHALLQSAAADSLLRSARSQLHRRIAEALQTRFSARAEAEPETLAHHLTEAGESLRAIPLWQRAGERALGRSALAEATAHLDAALALLHAVGEGRSRDAVELELQVMRASALRAVRGVAHPATGEAYERAASLARALGDTARLIPALNGLYAYHMVSGGCDAAMAPAQALLQVAREQHDAMYQMIGHRAVGAVAFHIGDPRTARTHLEQSLAAYDPERHKALAVMQGIDHKVIASNFLALTQFVLGEPDAALACQQAALAHAEQMDHAHSKTQALVFGCLLLTLRGDWPAIPAWAERAIELAQRRGFPLMEGGARFFLGAAQAFGGSDRHALQAGLAAMQDGAELWWGTGASNYRAYGEVLMAQAHAALGDLESARAMLRASAECIAKTGERWAEPELWRVEAELLHAHDGSVRTRLREALALAERQGATAWAQRIVQSLDALTSRSAARSH